MSSSSSLIQGISISVSDDDEASGKVRVRVPALTAAALDHTVAALDLTAPPSKPSSGRRRELCSGELWRPLCLPSAPLDAAEQGQPTGALGLTHCRL